jgi:Ca2+-dependent lipid-binding protein
MAHLFQWIHSSSYIFTAQDFAHELSKLRALVKERSKERLASYQMKRDESKAKLAKASEASSKSNLTRTLSLDSHVNILVEIVSATDLPIADMKSTDPYIVVYLGKQEVHRTKPISKT